jgi:hypothetical protein
MSGVSQPFSYDVVSRAMLVQSRAKVDEKFLEIDS